MIDPWMRFTCRVPGRAGSLSGTVTRCAEFTVVAGEAAVAAAAGAGLGAAAGFAGAAWAAAPSAIKAIARRGREHFFMCVGLVQWAARSTRTSPLRVSRVICGPPLPMRTRANELDW